ncbi:MAG TPA: TasA family protein [Candidatus Nanoarchaeia archaeon]
MKRILVSMLTIAIVAVVGFAVTRAYFSDTETSSGNTITAGTIDISVDDNNPWTGNFAISDMKPSNVEYKTFTITNVGSNPARIWKHIKDVDTEENGVTEPEQDWYTTYNGGVPKNDIDTVIEYDMTVGETTVIDPDDGITLDDIESAYVYLGTLNPGQPMTVTQSYHMRADTGNWAQSDKLTFSIEIYAEQTTGGAPGPTSTTLLLENKDGSWNPIIGDGKWGVLKWAGDGPTFDFSSTLKAHGLQPSTDYKLVYAPDPWPQGPLPGSPSTVLGSGTSDSNGDLTISGNVNLGYDLPHPSDNNYPTGAKIWLVLSGHHNGTRMINWDQSKYLFEYNLIKYDDTNAP